LEKYSNLGETAVLSEPASPRLFVFFWVLIGLLVALGAWLCFAEVETYTFGQGKIVLSEKTDPGAEEKKLRVVSFFPADIRTILVVGQPLMMRAGQDKKWHRQTIIAVEPRVLSPLEVKEKFGFVLDQPAAVTISCSDEKKGDKIYQMRPRDRAVEVRIGSGSRKIISFLPVLGGFFKKSSH
jgi:hypothetical protein